MQTNAMPVRLLGLALCVAGVVLLRKASINLGAGAFVLGLTVVSTAYRSKKPPVEVSPVFVKNLVIVLATWIGLGFMVFVAARSAPMRLSSRTHHDLTKGLAEVVLMVVGGYFYWAFAAGSRIALTRLARHLRIAAEQHRV